MRVAEFFGQTLRESPADAQLASHALLMRGAFIRQVAAGVYAWLPLGLRVLRKIEQVIREEMDAAGAVELLMPVLVPRELFDRSGRWDRFGVELYTMTDADGREWGLGPTHEEVATLIASSEIASYRDLPRIVYQVQSKFRYAPRPRGGLLRTRELLMKDAYSFDADWAGLDRSYARVADAYRSTFERLGVDALMVEADPGFMGGGTNHEFLLPAERGENVFMRCDCGYTANAEAASARLAFDYDFGDAAETPRRVHTPGRVRVEEVAGLLGVESRRLAKALLYHAGHEVVCALVPGDRDLNEAKLARVLDADVSMLQDGEFAPAGLIKGFAGPVSLGGVRVLADRSLEHARGLVTGANEVDYHLTDVVAGRDFSPDAWEDLTVAQPGDRCDRCGGLLAAGRAIEVAHIFQLGTRYSEKFDAMFTDQEGVRRHCVMGCYGFGVSRAVGAIAEVHHDERGLRWPRAVAPFGAVVLLLSSDPAAVAAAERLHGAADVALDDRPVSAGVKFADADLVGYPLQIVVGKRFLETGLLDATVRATGDRFDLEPSGIVAALEACP